MGDALLSSMLMAYRTADREVDCLDLPYTLDAASPCTETAIEDLALREKCST